MFLHALPFAISLTFVPVSLVGIMFGGWWLAGGILYGFLIIPLLDSLSGLNKTNLDIRTDVKRLFFHRVVTWIWAPVQLFLIAAALYAAGLPGHLTNAEKVAAFVGLGLLTGTFGINYAHELMHQKSRFERALSETLMTSTLYGHFCIEHLYGHHIHVATPEDPASAKYGENIFFFLPRSIFGGLISAWKIQMKQLEKRGLPSWHYTNAFWRYAIAYGVFLFVAYTLAGGIGVLLFCLQAFVAVTLLEIINYVEHYGLQRQLMPNGKYEPVQPHHSWNSSHRVSNYVLINLQRHSDHHKHPARRYPVLQHYEEDRAPQLPLGYPIMVLIALAPPLWFYVMNPKVKAWLLRHYAPSS